jgi:hypothetical protein
MIGRMTGRMIGSTKAASFPAMQLDNAADQLDERDRQLGVVRGVHMASIERSYAARRQWERESRRSARGKSAAGRPDRRRAGSPTATGHEPPESRPPRIADRCWPPWIAAGKPLTRIAGRQRPPVAGEPPENRPREHAIAYLSGQLFPRLGLKPLPPTVR